MNLMWIILAVAALGVIVKGAWPRKRDSESDLGFVSQQWLAEQRLAMTHDAQR